MKSTIFIIDDDPDFTSNLAWQLEKLGFTTKTFSFLETFFTFYQQDIPGCLIIDIHSAGNLGAELITTLYKKGIRLAVIFLSKQLDTYIAIKAIKLGAIDFFHKSRIDTPTLLHSIHQALQSNHTRRHFEANLQRARILHAQLTVREKEVFQYLLLGLTNKAMAEKLAITLKTIEAHRANVMHKMQAQSLPELVTLAVKFNLIQAEETCLIA